MAYQNPPILRGRDIKRYGYEWAGLWLIATFPARHYDIEQYPAVKEYLLSFAEDYLRKNGCECGTKNETVYGAVCFVKNVVWLIVGQNPSVRFARHKRTCRDVTNCKRIKSYIYLVDTGVAARIII